MIDELSQEKGTDLERALEEMDDIAGLNCLLDYEAEKIRHLIAVVRAAVTVKRDLEWCRKVAWDDDEGRYVRDVFEKLRGTEAVLCTALSALTKENDGE